LKNIPFIFYFILNILTLIMINIVKVENDIDKKPSKDGLAISSNGLHYYDENGCEVTPIIGEIYNFMGKEKSYPFN